MIWTEEQLDIRDLAREFAAGELRPHTAAWDADAALDDDVFRALAEVGFLGMRVPEEHGGLELDVATYLLVLEELAWGDAAVALSVAIHNGPVTGILVEHGDDAQKASWLPRIASGEVLGAFALSEPEAGSDAASLSTEATADGDGWILSGRKKWVTNGERAGVVLVFARTGPGHEIGCFLVEPSTPGYEVVGGATTMGLRASETVEVELDEVRLGPNALVGEADRGFHYAMEALQIGRAGIAAQAVGIGRAAMEHATEYALDREQFGRSIAEFGAVQEKLAVMATRVSGARALTHAVADRLQAVGNGAERGGGGGIGAAAAMAKLTASEAAVWVSDEAVQIFGGYGYMRDYPVEKLMRDAKGTEIYEGTNEIMKMVVARSMIRAARDARK